MNLFFVTVIHLVVASLNLSVQTQSLPSLLSLVAAGLGVELTPLSVSAGKQLTTQTQTNATLWASLSSTLHVKRVSVGESGWSGSEMHFQSDQSRFSLPWRKETSPLRILHTDTHTKTHELACSSLARDAARGVFRPLCLYCAPENTRRAVWVCANVLF